MPQFEIQFFPSEIFWTLVSFGLLFVLLKRLVLPRILAAIDRRTGEIERKMAAAQRSRETAARLHEEYAQRLQQVDQEARAIVEASALQAAEERSRLLNEWRQELQRHKQAFRKDMEHEKHRALQEVISQSAGLVSRAAEKVIKQSVDRRLADQAIAELLRELETVCQSNEGKAVKKDG